MAVAAVRPVDRDADAVAEARAPERLDEGPLALVQVRRRTASSQ